MRLHLHLHLHPIVHQADPGLLQLVVQGVARDLQVGQRFGDIAGVADQRSADQACLEFGDLAIQGDRRAVGGGLREQARRDAAGVAAQFVHVAGPCVTGEMCGSATLSRWCESAGRLRFRSRRRDTKLADIRGPVRTPARLSGFGETPLNREERGRIELTGRAATPSAR
ncbi:hypothetical protein [uncultured Sphingomonas sp.]|uniref:hypothetical protein n=1 Tax=uncultured Sphingomonas sp. TaxID=158754 RepID=UPI0025DE427E|nr:hypothetical protein [uncultured Sphingomonas sp.]